MTTIEILAERLKMQYPQYAFTADKTVVVFCKGCFQEKLDEKDAIELLRDIQRNTKQR
jgi:hypothetical protein